MRLLVLGGTAWLGGWVAAAALECGHEVTCLARGTSGRPPAGAAFVVADRDQPGAYDEIGGGDWDAVVDLARQPGHVRRAAAVLADRAGRFVFVSSASVYADHSTVGQDETAPTLTPLDGDVMETMESYGKAKAACEAHVLAAFGPQRTLIARAGLIGGPGDVSDRSGYWPWRFSRPAGPDGSVLVPDAPDQATQLVDVRDLADWLVAAAASGICGVFNAAGEVVTLRDHLQTARAVAGHTGPLVAAPSAWLTAHGVQPWMGERSLPMWLDDPGWAGFATRDATKARAAGLGTRPLEDTLADTLTWEATLDPRRVRAAGLTDADERTLLRELTS